MLSRVYSAAPVKGVILPSIPTSRPVTSNLIEDYAMRRLGHFYVTKSPTGRLYVTDSVFTSTGRM